MMHKSYSSVRVTVFFLLIQTFAFSQEIIYGDLNIIPQPADVEMAEGEFRINQKTKIRYDPAFNFSFDPFKSFTGHFRKKSGYELIAEVFPVSNFAKNRHNMLIHFDESFGSEEYKIQVTKHNILIYASASHGVYYAFQTLRQIIKLDILTSAVEERTWVIPLVSIHDKPRYAYRGMHLDVVRHFQPIEFVKKYIDVIAFYKFNTFHWHLTDDQGWRIEIKQYPRLQEIAAWRDETLVGHYSDYPVKYDGKKHGGYYTHEQITEVVAYAAERGIAVIPEIEMPGHAQAALAAYPELGCRPEPVKVATTWGVFEDVFCPNEITFTFLQNVLDEVITLFPSKYIHIGGDECPKTQWNESEFCNTLMQNEGLKDAHELQSYFIQRIEKYVNSKGRQIIGWDEILEGGLAPNATVMSWRGMEGGIAAAKLEHDVIMTPGPPLYFDHYQSDPEFEPIAIGGYAPVEKVYQFDPMPEGLSPEQQKHILGGQANIWTEYIETSSHLEYMAFPRVIALSEALWTPLKNKNYKNFAYRLIEHFRILDNMNVNYANHIIQPQANLVCQPEGLAICWQSILSRRFQSIYISDNPGSGEWQRVYPGDTTFLTESGNLYYKNKTTRISNIQWSPVKLISYNPTKSRLSKITGSPSPSATYPGREGLKALTDGLTGNKFFNGQEWCAWPGDSVVLDLVFDEAISIDSIHIGMLSSPQAWIYPPEVVEVKGSTDLVNYQD